MQITVNNVNITLTPEQIAQICEEAKPEFTYPIFKRSKPDGRIVKFTDLYTGEVVWKGNSNRDIGYTGDTWVPHTDRDVWEDVAYDAKRDLWDGQPVYAWDSNISHTSSIRFYNAVNQCTYSFNGKRDGSDYSYYEAINPANYTPWILKAFTTLQR